MTYYCKYGCGTSVKFDNKQIGPNGNKIPLNEDGTAHRCPKRPPSTIPCRDCTQLITFDENRKSSSGKMIPLDPNGSPHSCPISQFNRSKTHYNNQSKKENS